jgi:uncharacterized protein YjiK
VSDNTGKIYKLSFKGEVLDELPFVGKDLEGITIDKSNGNIYVVEEGLQHIDCLNQYGTLINTISTVQVYTSNSGSGFEGIAKNGDTLYIVFEKSPGLLIKYHIPSDTWTETSLTFANDYSDITYDETDKTLCILSDESKSINHCNLTGTLIASQSIDVAQPEGIAIDRTKKIAWIVSDQGNKLHRIILKI